MIDATACGRCVPTLISELTIGALMLVESVTLDADVE